MEECWCGNKNLGEYAEHYYRCGQCRTLISKYPFTSSMFEITSDEEGYYGRNYWESVMTKAAGKKTLSEVIDLYLEERVIYWMKYILKYVKPGADVAEIGCGLGQLSYALKCAGYEQTAYELSPWICDYIRQELKIQVRCGSFEEKAHMYDAILAFDVLEHVMDPQEFLRKCAESIKQYGVLCIQTPCYNPDLSYQEMLEECPRFHGMLKEEQHIYLYSKAAVERLLKSVGFCHIVFVPAFFGDDYDMFFFASKEPIQVNEEQEIDSYLNAVLQGRLIKAMIALFDEKQEYMQKYQTERENSIARLDQTRQLAEQFTESEADRAARLEQVQSLTKLLEESEADRAVRLEQVQSLTKMLTESEADRAARLEQVQSLTKMLEESEADRAARLEQIQKLTKMIEESKM
ncbi:MAG: methyltransferase domain-containing protein [Eubacterium sp.]|nr:methyltransferase domain-containing protein [Eubacterium sp.]